MIRALIISALLLAAVVAGAAAWARRPVPTQTASCACHGQKAQPPAWHSSDLRLYRRDIAARLAHGRAAAPRKATCVSCHATRAAECTSCHRPDELEVRP
ncbi:MAG: hypothetical protein IT370_13205 [Deltaproteobacteria bacterium]|nr:hypothetical protein [Deltaproteobacteria bacterium]